MKILGQEWIAFYNDKKYWSEDEEGAKNVWHEDELIKINGEAIPEGADLSIITNDDLIEIDFGVVHLGSYDHTISLLSYFKRWRKEQNTSTIIFTCSRDKEEYFLEKIKQYGGKII